MGRLLTPQAIGDLEWNSADLDMRFADDYPNEVRAMLEAQARETCREIWEKMMKLSTLKEFHSLRVSLIQGEVKE